MTDPGPALPRVVFVDDDASIRRYVAMALEDLPVEAIVCADAAAARAALRDGPAVLVLTDLMMPGESGLELLTALAADRTLRGPARLAVFSAGIDTAARQALQRLGVWRELSKPVGLQALQDCVRDALVAGLDAGPAPAAAAPAAPLREGARAAPAATPATGAAPGPDAAAQEAIQHLFGGDAALYGAFRAEAMAQFPADLAALEAGCAASDWPAVRRQAHSLKSALATLGDAPGSACARSLEDAAHAADAAACRAAWPALRQHLWRWLTEESDISRSR